MDSRHRQLNKALNVISKGSMEIAVVTHFSILGGDRMVRDAKRYSKRAQRRVDAALVTLGVAEYEDEDGKGCKVEF